MHVLGKEGECRLGSRFGRTSPLTGHVWSPLAHYPPLRGPVGPNLLVGGGARKSPIRSERSCQEHRQTVALARREIAKRLHFGQPCRPQEPFRAYVPPTLLAHQKLTERHLRDDRGRREQDF